MVVPAGSAAALSAVPPGQLGKASGVSNALQRWGAVFGVAIATAVFDARGSLASPETITNGYRPGLAEAAGLSVIGAVTAVAVRTAGAAGVATSQREGDPATLPAAPDA